MKQPKKAFQLLMLFILLTCSIALSTSFGNAQTPSDSQCILINSQSREGYYTDVLSWSPDGMYIAAMYDESVDNRILGSGIHVLDAQTFEIIFDVSRSILPNTDDLLVWSPDSRAVAVASGHPYEILIWNVDDNTSEVIGLSDNTEIIEQVVWSSDGDQLAVVSHESPRLGKPEFRPAYIIRIWDINTGEVIETSASNLDQALVTATENGWLLAVGVMDEATIRLTTIDGTEVYDSIAATDIVDLLVTDNDVFVVGFTFNEENPFDSTLTVWNATTSQPLIIIKGESALVASELQSSTYLIAHMSTLNWAVHRLSDGEPILSSERTRFHLSPDNRYGIAVELGQGGGVTYTPILSASLLRLIDGQVLAIFPPSDIQATGVAWSPMGNSVVTRNFSGIALWMIVDCD